MGSTAKITLGHYHSFKLIETPRKYREFFPTLFVRATNFQQTRTVTIFGEYGIIYNYPPKGR